jgi:GNAT superfamily N-acetyltransferase
MPIEAKIRQAGPADAAVVADIIMEAARWLEQAGSPMWKASELDPGGIAADVSAGLFFLAEENGDAAGTVRFQLEDPNFWPDSVPGEAAYIHRLTVRRRYAGKGVSGALLRWAVRRTRTLGRGLLRLDCEASRPRLRALYESFGFSHHSDRQAGPYFVSRYEFDVAAGGGRPCAGLATRRLGQDDIARAAAVHRASFDGRLPWLAGRHTPEQDLGFFLDKVFRDCAVWGAFEGGELVGIIAFREGWIDQFYVAPQAQGRGAGSALLRIAQSSFPSLSLWTFQRNRSARMFYEARGFAAVRETDGASNDEREPDVLLRWERGAK